MAIGKIPNLERPVVSRAYERQISGTIEVCSNNGKPGKPLQSHHKPKDSDDGHHDRRARNRRKESSKCAKCLRGTMAVYNVILLLVGSGGLGAGVWLMLKEFNAREVTALLGVNLFEVASYLLIAGGGVVALLAFCGCCGTMKEDKCVLGFFATTLTLMLLMLVSGSAMAFISKDSIDDGLQRSFIFKLITKYGVDVRTKAENRLVTDAWDSVQRELECCGIRGNVTGTDSWAIYKGQSKWHDRQKTKYPYVPESCCKTHEGVKDIGICTGAKDFDGPPRVSLNLDASINAETGRKENPYLSTNGCYEAVVVKIEEHALLIGFISASIPIFLIIGVVISCCLCFKVEKDPDDDDDSDFYNPHPV